MKGTPRTIALALLVLGLLIANWKWAFAHDWWIYHWDPAGNPKVIQVWDFAVHRAEAEAAINDWDGHVAALSFARVSSHPSYGVSVFDGNFGATGWWGLASIESTSYGWWDCWWWCHIEHAHARFNTYYGGSSADIQGVLCQEFGHTLGFDHSNTGDCMGKGYYNNINITGPHNWSDASKYAPGGVHP